MTVFTPHVIEMLNRKTGQDVTTLKGAAYLQHDIEKELKTYLALNTVKRLLGLLPYRFRPREETLQIFANYLGFPTWSLLQEYIDDHISEFGETSPFMDLSRLDEGVEIEISWDPDRYLKIKHLTGYEYCVVSAENSKLKKDDILTLTQLAEGFPFVVRSVFREGVCLGNYMAAKKLGLKNIRLL